MKKREKKDKFHISDKIKEKSFEIRLQSHNKELEVSTNPNFLRVLETQYASKYLEKMDIEPTQKNINTVLKYYPLKNCQITASWNDNSLYADTLSIKHLRKNPKGKPVSQPVEEQTLTEKFLKAIGQKKIDAKQILGETGEKEDEEEKGKIEELDVEDKNPPVDEGAANANKIKEAVEKKKESDEVKALNFEVENIKRKYLYPFNQTRLRKRNITMLEKFESEPNEDPREILSLHESKIFAFPFTKVKIPTQVLKEIQKPITAEREDIQAEIINFCDGFPKHLIPFEKGDQEEKKENQNPMKFQINKKETFLNSKKKEQDSLNSLQMRVVFLKERDVTETFNLLETPEMSKFIGLFIHLSYWMVFGHINPVQLDAFAKKQILVNLMHLYMSFGIKKSSEKVWTYLTQPLILLMLKMITELIFRRTYPLTFDDDKKSSSMALDKIFYLCERIFDQNNLYGRLIFFETDMKNDKSHIDAGFMEKRYLKTRIHGISPFIDLMIPQPKDSKSRTILSTKHKLELKDPMLKTIDTKMHNINNRPSTHEEPLFKNRATSLNEKYQENIENRMKVQMFTTYFEKLKSSKEKSSRTVSEFKKFAKYL